MVTLMDPDIRLVVVQTLLERRLKLTKASSISLLANGSTLSLSDMIGDTHARHRDKEDDILYLKYVENEAFGGGLWD
jgi:hypothetical protein